MDLAASKAALQARLANPNEPAFPGAVALSCEVCGRHLTWTNPPAPSVPTVCAEHRRPGALTMVERA